MEEDTLVVLEQQDQMVDLVVVETILVVLLLSEAEKQELQIQHLHRDIAVEVLQVHPHMLMVVEVVPVVLDTVFPIMTPVVKEEMEKQV